MTRALLLVLAVILFFNVSPSKALRIRRNEDDNTLLQELDNEFSLTQLDDNDLDLESLDVAAETPSPTKSPTPKSTLGIPRWLQITVCVFAMFVGLLLMLVGYRLFRVSVFIICGFVAGSLMFGILDAAIKDSVHNKVAITYGVSVPIGFIAAMICACFPKLGIFFSWCITWRFDC